MTTMTGNHFVKTSYRAAASVIAIAIASLTVPSLAQAKRMGSSKSVRPASIGSKAPAQPAPVAPAAAAPKAAAPATPAAPPLRQLLRLLPQQQRLLPLVAPA
jgi:acetyl-CoA decarbonylase/synthase complex subunit delta